MKPPCVVRGQVGRSGVEQMADTVTSREACSVSYTGPSVMAEQEESSLSPKGEDHGRHQGSWSGCPGTSRRRGLGMARRLSPGTGEINAGKHKAAGRQPSVPGSHDVDNQRPWETAKCRTEVGGGSSSDDDRDNITRFERRASSQVCEATSDDRGIVQRAIPPTRPTGQVNGLGVTLGSSANARGTAECARSTAWGKAVCGRTACTVWEGGTGEVDAQARWNTHPKGN